MEYSNLYMWRHGHNVITAKGKKEVSMTLSDELWSDCWSTLIFSCGNIDIINHCQKKERSFNATVRLIVICSYKQAEKGGKFEFK